MIDPDALYARLRSSLDRVRNLVSVYEQIGGNVAGRRSAKQIDTLRAATVLLHATLENFLREIATERLPLAAPEVIGKIPLPGQSGEKFNLGAISPYRTMTVQSVIEMSVHHSLERSNYNSTSEIAALLQNVGLGGANVAGLYPALTKLMERRHQIVHRADLNPVGGQGNHGVRSLNPKSVNGWLGTVDSFAGVIRDELHATAAWGTPPPPA